jgi:hypothetical protein
VAIGLPAFLVLSKPPGELPIGGAGMATRPGSGLPSEPSGPRIGGAAGAWANPLLPSRLIRLCVVCGAPVPGRVADVLLNPGAPLVLAAPPVGVRPLLESGILGGGGIDGSPGFVGLPGGFVGAEVVFGGTGNGVFLLRL